MEWIWIVLCLYVSLPVRWRLLVSSDVEFGSEFVWVLLGVVQGIDESICGRVVSEVASSVFDSLVITSVEYSVFRRLSPLRSFR